ncbi:MAG: NADH-quinone oxidoreductase subunit C [Thermoanaerobaculia bacterium]|nr:NADH-quinone oxidoreductase subunit C [Thermoanaerobaculia bacterium]
MEAHEVGNGLREAFGSRVEVAVASPKRLYVRVAAVDLPEAARWLRSHLPGCRLATSTGIDLRDGIGLFHHFAVNGQSLVITLKTLLEKPAARAPSLARETAAADWIEREIHDLLGVAFEGHPDERRLVKAEAMADELPLRRGFDVARFKERIGERPGF